MQHRTSIAAATVLLGLVAGALSASGQFLPVILNRGAPGIRSIVFVVSIVAFLASPVGLLVLGYWAGRRVDVPEQYGALLLLFGLVGGGATAFGYLVVSGLALVDSVATGPINVLFGVGYNAVVQALNFAVTGFAGAAFAEFRTT